MGMFSEIATEDLIQVLVVEIKKELGENKDKPDALASLKKLGRFALQQFEWSTPNWTKEYEELFRE